MISVLDFGYVRYVDHMGSDLSVVNAARVSYARESKELIDKDVRLLKFLANAEPTPHTAPLRHAVGTMEVCAPLMVAREWWKYVVGSDHTMDGWNEVSRRYVADQLDFYTPEEWRSKPANSKQGSGGPLPTEESRRLSAEFRAWAARGVELYLDALAVGAAPEQARIFLPAYALYTKWRWTFSLQSLIHFMNQRMAPDAQWEIRQYAKAVYKMWHPKFPHSIDAFLGKDMFSSEKHTRVNEIRHNINHLEVP